MLKAVYCRGSIYEMKKEKYFIITFSLAGYQKLIQALKVHTASSESGDGNL